MSLYGNPFGSGFNLGGFAPMTLGGFGQPVGNNTSLDQALSDVRTAQSFTDPKTSQLLGMLAQGTSWAASNPDPLDQPAFIQSRNFLFGRPQVGGNNGFNPFSSGYNGLNGLNNFNNINPLLLGSLLNMLF